MRKSGLPLMKQIKTYKSNTFLLRCRQALINCSSQSELLESALRGNPKPEAGGALSHRSGVVFVRAQCAGSCADLLLPFVHGCVYTVSLSVIALANSLLLYAFFAFLCYITSGARVRQGWRWVWQHNGRLKINIVHKSKETYVAGTGRSSRDVDLRTRRLPTSETSREVDFDTLRHRGRRQKGRSEELQIHTDVIVGFLLRFSFAVQLIS